MNDYPYHNGNCSRYAGTYQKIIKGNESMSYKVSDIVYENGHHWVLKVAKGYEVYKIGVTCSTRCAIIGFEGEKGLEHAKYECDKRENTK